MADLVDFSLIAKDTPRLMVGAANVRTSMMRYFDSRETEITVDHIMASGALPPLFQRFASTANSIGTAASCPTRRRSDL